MTSKCSFTTCKLGNCACIALISAIHGAIRFFGHFCLATTASPTLTRGSLITKPGYLTGDLFKVPPAEHNKLKNKDSYVTTSFEKYVRRYIKAYKSGDKNILNGTEYRFTTLQNYFTELGIDA
jgi:hypothetical protein